MKNILYKDLLEQSKKTIKEAQERVKNTYATIDPQLFNKKPAPKSWSAGQCLEHLVITGEGYLKQFEQKIPQAIDNKVIANPNAEFNSGFFGNYILKIVDPNYPKKNPTTKAFTPKHNPVPLTMVEDFLKLQDKWLQWIDKSQQLDLMKVKITSPALFIIQFRLGDVFVINANHQIRHLNQADRAMKS